MPLEISILIITIVALWNLILFVNKFMSVSYFAWKLKEFYKLGGYLSINLHCLSNDKVILVEPQ